MGKINVGRLILGGIVAGIVGDALGYLVDGVLLSDRWTYAMQHLGRTQFSSNQWVVFNLIGLVAGILAVWLYTAIRPRYGAGPMTAVYAGLGAWAIGTLMPNAALWAAGILPRGLAVLTTSGAIVETVVAVVAGAALYQEQATVAESRAAHA